MKENKTSISKREMRRTEIQKIATRVVYENGFRATTLADVAKAADFPLGSVYYYFKTKAELGEAVSSFLLGQAHAMFARWDELNSAEERLLQFISMTFHSREALVKFGCPIGTLCAEFGKDFPDLVRGVGGIYELTIDWMSKQFNEIASEGHARARAVQLMSSLEGVALVAQGLGDQEIVSLETDRLKSWVTNLNNNRENKDETYKGPNP